MKLFVFLTAAAVSLLVALPASALTTVYSTTLSGAAEAPPNASPGTGTARVTLDDVARSLRVEATFSGLTGTTTAAHIHCCTAAAGTGIAGVATMVPSFAGFPLGVVAGTFDTVFDLTSTTSFNPAFVTASGGTVGLAFAALAAGLDAGTTYFNVHTSTFPGGEIRGFLVPAIPEPSTYALLAAGLGALGAMARRRQKKVPSAR